MKWFYDEDKTKPVIAAAEHIKSSHGQGIISELPSAFLAAL